MSAGRYDTAQMVAWLRDTIEEDKRIALDALRTPWADHWHRTAFQSCNGSPMASTHIAHHGPADVIADCEAKLRILDEFIDDSADLDMKGIARTMAYGYRHREGWQDRWRP